MGACATTAPLGIAEAGALAPAQRIDDPVAADQPIVEAGMAERESESSARGRESAPLATLLAANAAARQRPSTEAFDGARQIYAYEPGALYELYANPNYISTILLEPGETLIDIAAGDTARWMVTETAAETQAEGRTIVLVKPQTRGLRTNIVLITDRRTYLIEAISQTGEAYAAQIAWTYPRETLTQAPVIAIDRINLDYRIRTIRGRAPVWTPVRVFDDGRRTWIEFAPEVAAADMPPLFVMTGEGAEIANYRVAGRRYMVDRLFDAAELRLGVRAPVVVRIERISALPPRTAPRRRGPRS
jgi:type IV secretion system protein VirB9